MSRRRPTPFWEDPNYPPSVWQPEDRRSLAGGWKGVAEALEAAADIAARDRYVEEQGRMDDDNGD